jgi:GNAT superfamily N-acetyltransferase
LLSHRLVQLDDLPRICTFPQSADELFFLFPKATHPLTPEQLHGSIEHRVGSTVVLRDGVVCAFANLYAMRPEGTYGIGNVVVAPDARGQGVGRYLVEAMIRTALVEHGARSVEIACFNANVSGLLLYQKLGFVPYAIEPRVDHRGNRVALVRMRLPLATSA